jgi:hypothetical protein
MTDRAAFSWDPVPRARLLNLNTIVEDIGTTARHMVGTEIELSVRLDNDLGSVLVDPMRIEEVLLNLTLNARYAMPRGRRIVLETANFELYGDNRAVRDLARSPWVAVTVTASGCPRSGVGWGSESCLSTCGAILHESAGFLIRYSELGRKTFMAALPRIERAKAVRRVLDEKVDTGRQTQSLQASPNVDR